MTRQYIDQMVKAIEGMYNRSYSDPAKQILFRDLEGEPNEVAVPLMRKLESDFTTLPVPVTLVKTIKEISASIRESRASQEKRQMEVAVNNTLNPRADGLAKNTVMLVRALMSGKITRQKYLDGIRKLDGMYPHAGFAASGNRIQENYHRLGVDLEKPPGGYGDYE